MAGADYVSCAECGKRLFYDGSREARVYMQEFLGLASVTCDHCVSKLKKKIEELRKHDKRRH